ncbi:MAG: hypothetical protein NTV00_09350 [Methylococcales bacterium]|nr:hypothetical protein [Methylococcales bacterium]
MIDFILGIFSTIFQINMRDLHDVPFAMPLMMGAIMGLIIGFTILSFIGNEERSRQIARTEGLEK